MGRKKEQKMKTITDDGEILDTNCEDCGPIAVAPPFWKTPHNHDRDAESARYALTCNDKSKTQQQFAKDADINVILAKFMQTGELNLTGTPLYQDADAEFDLRTQSSPELRSKPHGKNSPRQ